MAGRDNLDQVFADIRLGLGLFTRLPFLGDIDVERGSDSAWAWPLAGLVPAALAALLISLSNWLGFGAGFAAALGLAAAIMATGAMHEDGLADTADGFWGGWDPARRLEIMKDSRIGAYGVIALILSLLARWSLVTTLIVGGWVWAPLLAVAMLSRAPMVGLMAWLEPARESGLSRAVGRPVMSSFWVAGGIALGLSILLCGFTAIWAGIAAVLVAALLGRVAAGKIGGQTGDLLGASQQLAEIVALAVLASALA